MPGNIHRIREEETPSMADQLRMYFVIVDIPYWYLHPFANVDIVLSSNDVTIRVVWHIVSSGGVADAQPITQLFPSLKASSVALTHLSLVLSVSWLMWT